MRVRCRLFGTNWLSQILTDLVTVSQKKTQDRESSVNDEELEEFPYLEFGDAEKYERMTKLPSPRFIASHLHPENLPKSIFKNKVKILLLIRNPKDVATSFYHFSNGLATLPSYETWDDFFTDFMSKRSTVYYSVCLLFNVFDWKNLFSEDQNEKMDKAFEEYVGGTKLGKKLKYEVYCKA
ncbi:sulfotransferase 6B1-like [Empidonax traillii]|uniref:sulfotransferase 6B1-like n=1 Tax=Empidonax traillii TaxID=164674 RepID=UPI000FFD73A0|nr:sulfotransferase 6B1-like [Empidonax traillii]